MVCRENKGRSAVMGYEKHMLRSMGYNDYRDFEVQSGIHEYAHVYEEAPAPSTEEQLTFLRGLRQQVMNDPTVPDEDKTRVSHKQPGLVTRIDQEVDRLRTGADENGRPLRSEQMNTGKHFAAMKRLGVLLQRGQEAKEGYVETYSRTMGCNMDEGRRRWDELASRTQEERQNTRISLNDGWRDRLSAAGVTAKQQADLGQSNVTREALRVMESERQARLRTLPSRPAVRDKHREEVLHPDSVEAQTQCAPEGCGQFGHERAECPHSDRVAAVTEAKRDFEDALRTVRYTTAREQSEAQAARAKEAGDDRTAAQLMERSQWLAGQAPDADPAKLDELVGRCREAEQTYSDAQTDLDRERGPVKRTSARIQEIAYNPDSGHLEVTTRPRKRVRTGDVAPEKTYMYRMSHAEYQEMMAADSLTSHVSRHVWARPSQGGNDGYKYENADEERVARQQVRCATCGQWASPTSSHQCVVEGSRQATEDAARTERVRAAREQGRMQTLPTHDADIGVKRVLLRPKISQHMTGDEKGLLHYPAPLEMEQQMANGQVGVGPIQGQYLRQRVTGRVYGWRTPDGRRVYSVDTVNCTCGGPPCRHVDKATATVGARYGATQVQNVTPGGRVVDSQMRQAPDAPDAPLPRRSYQTIRNERANAAQRDVSYIEHLRRTSNLDSMRAGPAFGHEGQMREPTTWSNDSDKETEVSLKSATQTGQALRRNLNKQTASSWTVAPTRDGSLRVTGSRGPDQPMSVPEQEQLARALDLPIRRVGPHGVCVPPDASWRAEFLDRSSGRTPRVNGARFVARGDQTPSRLVTP